MSFNSSQRKVIRFLDEIKKEEEKSMKDKVTAYIRTYAPILAGGLASWLATLGLTVSSEVQSAIIILLTALLQALYYALARLVGSKFPKAERWLLGSSKQPKYEE